MSTKDELHKFERKLESALKSAFSKEISDDGDFEISADYDTHSRINDIVKGLDLSVHGMSIVPSEFTITFKFCGSYQLIDSKQRPNYCTINLQNDGNYSFYLKENDLKKDWYLSITDVFFNTKTVPEDVIDDCLTQLNHTLLLKILSN